VQAPAPRFVLLVIGDEILLGKRSDRHFARVVASLGQRGFTLESAHFLGDDEERLAGLLAQCRGEGRVVLCCGGIGATPDDVTRQAAARAWGVALQPHPEALAEILARFGEKAYPSRALMADFPEGARVIPNPINRIAGFSVGDQHFVPGFPEMAWPMLDWVLDTYYEQRRPAVAAVDMRLRVGGTAAESDLLDLMEACIRLHPGIRLSSLPFRGNGEAPPHIELGVRAEPGLAARAFAYLREQLAVRAVPFEILQGPAAPAPVEPRP
jgi:molybdopterin-biosynthesis enzyme MoeA-like protein